jgi:hypothetical protein
MHRLSTVLYSLHSTTSPLINADPGRSGTDDDNEDYAGTKYMVIAGESWARAWR